MKIEKAPKEIFDAIEEYQTLDLGGKKIVCPYFINSHRSKDLRAMVGKGTPEEIVQEARIWEKLKGVNFNEMTETEIREFLKNRGIGIDCSGFTMHILNKWYQDTQNKNIWKKLKPYYTSFLGKIAYKLKPVEKLGAEIITNAQNSEVVAVKDVRPLDLIRLKWKKKNSHHVLMVVETERTDKTGKLKKLKYAHSIPKFGEESGVKFGEIKITDQNEPLEKQDWLEQDENGVKHTLEGYMINLEDNGIRRLKALVK